VDWNVGYVISWGKYAENDPNGVADDSATSDSVNTTKINEALCVFEPAA
jgi:hypothetical protein